MTPNSFVKGHMTLVANDSGGVPQALQTNLQNTARMDGDALIIDHISGKVSWDIEGNGGDTADAAGNWLFALRYAIVISSLGTQPGGGGLSSPFFPTVDGVAYNEEMVNPGANVPAMLQGSFGPEGFRVLWRRSWQIMVNFATGFGRDGIVSSEEACPPGGYVDIKPKRILRGNESLMLVWYHQAIGLTGAENSARVWTGHDLRIAGHNTLRRR